MGATFRCRLCDLPSVSTDTIVGRLTIGQSGFTRMYGKSVVAWKDEIEVLRGAAQDLIQRIATAGRWTLLLEYEIPLRNRRPDAVLIADDMIFVLEFKIGAERHLSADQWQVRSYALDLRDFHACSRDRWIVPILVATDAPRSEQQASIPFPASADAVSAVQCANRHDLAEVIRFFHSLRDHPPQESICGEQWENAGYQPTPTIIQAAQRLFAGQSVENINIHGATNLTDTTDAIIEAIEVSQQEGRRTVCFVTGVPGAGKTLTGLKAVHDRRIQRGNRPAAVFLSGNGPLVDVITEALVRELRVKGKRRDEAEHEVTTFIASVHQFVKLNAIENVGRIPDQNAIIFDEAQRAWSAEKVDSKHGVPKSEPELLLDVMKEAPGWATIVALVGGGQEIHDGEAGLEEWGRAIAARADTWQVRIASHLIHGSDSGLAGHRLFDGGVSQSVQVVGDDRLHLSVSVRSHRARMIGEWVNALLIGQPDVAFRPTVEFPVFTTRDLGEARAWLGDKVESRGSEVVQRTGLLESSGALRLRSFGIEVSKAFRDGCRFPYWFLNPHGDIRSSTQLEVAATEFECQGLELDWTCVCWGGDMVIHPSAGTWEYRRLRATNWQTVGCDVESYIRNKYRVLLTRARKGMVIWVPKGDPDDPSRDPAVMDATAEYLASAGIPAL
jgi:hypothetical protein